MSDGEINIYAVMLRQLEIIELDVRTRATPLTEQEKKRFIQVVQLFGSNSQVATLLAEGGIVMNQGDTAGRDLIKQSVGGDMKGVAAGERATANYFSIEANQILTTTDLKKAFENVANNVGKSDLPVATKAKVLPELMWWIENCDTPAEPPEAKERASKLQQLANVVGKTMQSIVEKAAGGLLTHWVVEVLKNAAQ